MGHLRNRSYRTILSILCSLLCENNHSGRGGGEKKRVKRNQGKGTQKKATSQTPTAQIYSNHRAELSPKKTKDINQSRPTSRQSILEFPGPYCTQARKREQDVPAETQCSGKGLFPPHDPDQRLVVLVKPIDVIVGQVVQGCTVVVAVPHLGVNMHRGTTGEAKGKSIYDRRER